MLMENLFMARRPGLPDGAGPLLIGLSGGRSASSLTVGQDGEGLWEDGCVCPPPMAPGVPLAGSSSFVSEA